MKNQLGDVNTARTFQSAGGGNTTAQGQGGGGPQIIHTRALWVVVVVVVSYGGTSPNKPRVLKYSRRQPASAPSPASSLAVRPFPVVTNLTNDVKFFNVKIRDYFKV